MFIFLTKNKLVYILLSASVGGANDFNTILENIKFNIYKS